MVRGCGSPGWVSEQQEFLALLQQTGFSIPQQWPVRCIVREVLRAAECSALLTVHAVNRRRRRPFAVAPRVGH